MLKHVNNACSNFMENSLNHSLPKQMEIITIDSSDSDGDVEFEPDAPFGGSVNINATAQSRNVSERLTDQYHDWLVHTPSHHGNGLDNRLGQNGKDEASALSPGGSMQASHTKYHPEFMPQKGLSDSVINGEFGVSVGSVEGAMYDPQLQKQAAALMPQANCELGSINVGNTTDGGSSQTSTRILPSSLLSHKSRHISVPIIASPGKALFSPHESSMQAERNKISRAGQGIAADDNSRRDAYATSSNFHMEDANTMKEKNYIYEKETRTLPVHWIDKTANKSQMNASMHSRVTGHMEDAHTMKEKNPVYEKETIALPFHWIDRASNSSQMNVPMHSMATGQDSYFISKPSHPMLASRANNVHKFSDMSIRNEKSISSSRVHEVRDDVSAYENVPATRTLPQYPSKSNGYLRPASYNDGVNFPGLVEQRPDHDETPIYQEALQNLGQPKLEDDLPEGLLTVSLLKHQKIALAWMVQKEKSVYCAGGILADDQGLGKTISMIALILKQLGLQSKFMTDDSCNFRPEAFSLDDDGGNDETETKQSGEDIHRKPVASTSENRRPAAGTLVICPASVLKQWQRELQEKVSSSSQISVLFYHGARTKDPRDLAKYDVVLTTYSIVANEVPKHSMAEDDDDEQRNMEKHGLSPEFAVSKKRKQTSNAGRKGKKKAKGLKGSQLDYGSGPLARVRWFRVILDEAQTIKNHRTQVARACSALRAKRRWCLSGTPMQNAIDDLYSYFRFLKYDPYAVYSSFCNSIKHPISRNASQGYKKLQAVLRIVMLRRTKGTLINGEPIVKLPPKSICLENVEFSPEERAFYLKLEADYRQQFKFYAAAGTVKQNYASILLMLLRLRQACDHPVLVKGYYSEAIARDSLEMAGQLPKEMLSNLLYQLEAKLAICPVCNDTTEDPVVTMCGHVFCYQCVADRITGDDNTCPAIGCKDILGTDSVFSQATLKSCISDERDNKDASSSSSNSEESSIVQRTYVSSKIRAAVNILNSICSQCSHPCEMDGGEDDWFSVKPEKAIVFSQWTGMLDLVEISLNHSLIQYRRLDGTMSLSSRDRSVREFTTDPEVKVMLMSLKAGNLGLNMVAACHVILLDLWWNPTTEDQAIDRAHRIGQTRPVTVTRLTIKDTVEDRILALQEEKRKMVSSAFGEDHAGNHAARLTVEDLKYLFRV